VRGQDEPGNPDAEQGVIRARWLPAEDVESRAPQSSGDKGLGERGLVDDLAARRVDDDRPRPEPRDCSLESMRRVAGVYGT
jgi:hypothetical protein